MPAVVDASTLAVAADVRDAVDAELDLLLSDLTSWVRRDSPSGDRGAVDGLAQELAATLRRYGLETDLVPETSGLHLHAWLEGRGRTRVALLGHHDTVFGMGTARLRPLRQDGDHLVGPGVADMKGGLAVAVHAARILARGPRPFGRLELVSVPDEEIRASPFATLDRVAGFDAAFCLECGRPGGGVVTARKGGRWPVLRAHGQAAHAGTEPERGSNAVLALCAEALRIDALTGARDGLSVEVTAFDGRGPLNAVPADATLTVDIRGWHADDLDWALAEVARCQPPPGVRIEVERALAAPPLERTPPVARLAEAAAELGLHLGAPVHEVHTGGVSDACHTAGRGIPTLDGLGPIGGLDHGPLEYVERSSFAARCGLVAGLVVAVERAAAARAGPPDD